MVCSIDGYGDIDDAYARLLAQHAAVLRRVITDPITAQPLNVGRSYRLAPQRMALRVLTRDGQCRFPGCTRPAIPGRVELDHVTAWAAGGATADANLIVLCRNHHVAKTGTHWSAAFDPDTAEVTWTNRLLGITLTTTTAWH